MSWRNQAYNAPVFPAQPAQPPAARSAKYPALHAWLTNSTVSLADLEADLCRALAVVQANGDSPC